MTVTPAVISLNQFRRDSLPRIADALAAAVVASLPWSTSATGILIVLWLVAVLPVLDIPALRLEVGSLPGGLPALLAAMAIVGLCWGEASFPERLRGIEPFLRLATIPLLFAQFRRSDRGIWVGYAFLLSTTILLVMSFGMVLLRFGDLGHGYGVPVKDYIAQSGAFTLCGFGLFDVAADRWAERRRWLAVACLALGLLFIADIVYITTGRTTLAVMPALFLLWGVHRRLSRRHLAAFLLAGLTFGAVVWATSPYVRARVTGIFTEITEYQQTGKETSAGSRVEFWKNSLRVLREAPVWGHGTGTIAEVFRRFSDPRTGSSATNPHNQIFTVGIQLGAIGVGLLLAMWVAHWAMFYRPGRAGWIGLMAVTQNIVGSLFNSHLLDFTQSWIYVFSVGIFGGIVLSRYDADTQDQTTPSIPSPS